MTTHRVTITTGAYSGSGTTSQVFLMLRGDKGDTEKILLDDALNENGLTGKNKFQSGGSDSFFISVPDIGELRDIRLVIAVFLFPCFDAIKSHFVGYATRRGEINDDLNRH